jgi:hypothetical protein
VRELLFKLLPYGTGALIGYLLFASPQWLVDLGPLRWLVVGAAFALFLLAAVGMQLAVGLPENVGVEPHDETPRDDERLLARRFENLGFEHVGAPLKIELRPAARMQVLADLESGCWATVFATTTLPRKVGCDVFSVIEGERGSLTTLADPNGAVLPLAPGSFRQVFAGATPDELVRRHLEAVVYLNARGVRFETPTGDDLPAKIRRSIATQRRTVMANPIRASIVTLWRALSKRSPFARPLGEQKATAASLRFLSQGVA